MLLTISTDRRPATDLGYLLHKHPAKLQSFPLAFGSAEVFYLTATDERCTAALMLNIDPVALVRRQAGAVSIEQYVNDRPYVASSLLSVAIAQVFGSALGGRCAGRPELATERLPLQATIAALPCRGGDELLRRLFEPLGYELWIERRGLDAAFPQWGHSDLHTVTLRAHCTLSTLLNHLYVLIPVLDNEKHYWVGDEEVDKLLRHGGEWLARHPERELIATRYLKYQRSLAKTALSQLREQDDEAAGPEDEPSDDPREEAGERKLSLHEQRHGFVLAALEARSARSVVDLGCGEGRLLKSLMKQTKIARVIGVDVSSRALEIAESNLKLDRLPPKQRERIRLVQGSLLYRDRRLERGGDIAGETGVDAAVLCEVIEHVEPSRLAAVERVVFECIAAPLVVVTTPNREYNVMWESLPAGAARHRDHRFEWTRAEFADWCGRVAQRFGYEFETRGVGEAGVSATGHEVGCPTQAGVFRRAH